MSDIRLGNLLIGQGNSPYIVAEMSGNHNHSLERALAIVDAAAGAGVHALKLQTYTADTMTLNIESGDFMVEDPQSLWSGRSLYNLYQEAYTPWEWHKPIFDRCREHGIIGFSTPFDTTAVDFLEELDVPCYKIASFELTDLPLIRKVATTRKPIILSTGMGTVSEIGEAVQTARTAGCKDIILLQCTSTYPASPENSNLLTIPHMRELFNCEVGLSDHTMGIGVAIASVALGAVLIEKHFTTARKDGGVDSAFSMEPAEMRMLVSETEHAWSAIGTISYGPTLAEEQSLKHRRSLYIIQDLAEGDVLSPDNLRSIRPCAGLSPKYWDIVIGKRVNQSVKAGTALGWHLF